MEVSVIVATVNTDEGVYKDVAIIDPTGPIPDGLIENMADNLNTSPDDPDFNWDERRVPIPESLLEGEKKKEVCGLMIRKELKKAIIDWLMEHETEWQRVTTCYAAFRPYIYDSYGSYVIGGEDVTDFIRQADKLIYG